MSSSLIFEDLSRLVLPRSIAVVGASDRLDSIGARTIENLTRYSDWRGEISLINPGKTAVFDMPCLPSVLDLREMPDVAIITVRAEQVLQALRECGQKGIRFAIVFTSGFAEMGDEGRAIEAQMREIVAQTGLRIYGPNCPGLNNINAGLGMSFSPAYRLDRMPGPIGVATQGGGMGRSFMQSAMARGVGTGLWFSGGNEVDLQVSDYIHYMADAEDIRVIYTVLEGVRDGPRFMAAALQAARRGKPIVALKVGKSDYGAKAAASHTAAIAGSAEINSAVFRELGIVEVDDITEAVDVASLLARGQATGREKITVYCFSGGSGAMTSDRIGIEGLEMAELAPHTLERLKEVLPPYAPLGNPVDVTGEVLAKADIAQASIEATVQDPNTDVILVPIPVEYGKTTELLARCMVNAQVGQSTPIVPIWMSDQEGAGHRLMVEGGLAPTRSVRNAVLAVRRYVAYGQWKASRDHQWEPLGDVQVLSETVSMTEAAAKQVLAAAGIHCPQGIVVQTAAEAANAFSALGAAQVVMKVVSTRITHKTDVGGVQLGIASAAQAASAFDLICAKVQRHHDTSWIEGVLIEPMAERPFVEAVVGIHRDPVYGHVCTFGLGGVSMELFKDVSRRLLPLTADSAHTMVMETRCHQLLTGYRGQQGFDLEALVTALVRLSDFVVKHAQTIEELEINPLAVCPQGKGIVALDAVLRHQSSESISW